MKPLPCLLAVCALLISPWWVSGASTGTPERTIVTVSAEDPEAVEPGPSTTAVNPGRFLIRRTATFTNLDLRVQYTLSGSASNGVDYSLLPGFAVIPAGRLFVNVEVTPRPDNILEGRETVTLRIEPPICPAIFPPPPECYEVGTTASATVYLYDSSASNPPPFVRILAPTNGQVFPANHVIAILANAWDTNGTVTKVEFLGDNHLIGLDTSSPFEARWEGPLPGRHRVQARATDDRGAVGVSAVVEFTVTDSGTTPLQPVVTITALDALATEIPPVPEGMGMPQRVDVAVFRVQRTEPLHVPIEVHYQVAGTASNGFDYLRLPGRVLIPAGERSADITIMPIFDTLEEREETVAIRVEPIACIAIYPPPPECYLVGEPSEATAVIRDSEVVVLTNRPPEVAIATPTQGALFEAPADIPIIVRATDPDGFILTVELYNGTNSLGQATNNPLALSPFNPFVLIWSNVPPGDYALRAKATDDRDASAWSAPVHVTVKPREEPPFVTRQLPPFYIPGVTLQVRLAARPITSTSLYVIEDAPPVNWPVTGVSDGGETDPATGRVRFGPFQDDIPRVFTYHLTPPLAATGPAEFTGTAMADRTTSRISGARVIRPAPPHPADQAPTNMVIELAELTDYVNAWRTCPVVSGGPSPVPVNYVTRAGFLFRRGGAYTYSTNQPTPLPPLLWVPVNDPSATDDTLPELEPNTPTGWSTEPLGTAIRTLLTNSPTDRAFDVIIRVIPPANALAWAVEERVPQGWLVASMSDGGVFCRLTGKIKFGLFRDTQARELRYSLTPAADSRFAARFAGVASFDGINHAITGLTRFVREQDVEPPPPRLIWPRVSGWNLNLCQFPGEVGTRYRVEASTDLINWIPIESLLNSDGILDFIDPEASRLDRRFYRIVTE